MSQKAGGQGKISFPFAPAIVFSTNPFYNPSSARGLNFYSMLRFDVITIFPDIFNGFVNQSLLARAQQPRRAKDSRGSNLKASEKKPIISIKIHNLRNWTKDKHQTVDDRPYGGGAGMVFKPEPILKAVRALKSKFKIQNSKSRSGIVLFSPRGKTFTQTDAKRLSKYDQLILICGRYEGVDERIADYIANEMISIGNFVLNGGEVAAMVVIEAIARMLPGFIAKKESVQKTDFAQYTRPEVIIINGKRVGVPAVLLSGNHRKIAEWRSKHRSIGRDKHRKST